MFSDRVRLITPVIMGPACVSCHNIHPESPKRDWKVGDVRGIQEVSITQPIAANIFSFKYLLAYFALAAISGVSFLGMQRRQAKQIQGMNRELESTNDFLAALSLKISRYISPQVYKSIFSGEKDVTIHTERKKLTIFFSDIQNFTATTERLQPEQITQLLNEYFTEMSAIAHEHGGTIDKFIGDAMLIFFGDPETKGDRADAQACVRMAWSMQRRLLELNAKWRAAGIEHPFKARMGINSGYCNVGNFGSSDRMDYTIIGAEANLAARLQSIAEPGGIVVSYETFALASDVIAAHPLAPITMKGISREVIPYSVDNVLDTVDQRRSHRRADNGAGFLPRSVGRRRPGRRSHPVDIGRRTGRARPAATETGAINDADPTGVSPRLNRPWPANPRPPASSGFATISAFPIIPPCMPPPKPARR